MTAALLIVDDDPRVTGSLVRVLRDEGYRIHAAAGGREGLDLLDRQEFGVVLSDRMMPEMDGIRFLEMVRQRQPDVSRILMTGHGSLDSAMEAIERAQLFGYLLKPWIPQDLKKVVAKGFEQYGLVRENRRLLELTAAQNRQLAELNLNLEKMVRQRTAELEQTVRDGILMLAKAAEAKDDQTGGHVQRIQRLAESIGDGLGMPPPEAEALGLAAITHDVGKIRIPDRILQKQAALSPEEWEIMKGHTQAGAVILGDSPRFRTAREIARSHHERWDGTGYPDGLTGTGIPLPARIVAVADVFDALVSPRPYKPAWTRRRALAEIERVAGSSLDPEIVRVFLEQQRLQGE
jgi:putative two-component system response regulator